MDQLVVNNFDITNIMSRMSLFIGGSSSGKSCIMTDSLYKLKELIPNVLVISPTESQNQTYCKFIPAECIIDENISPEKLIVKLNDVY